MSDDENVKDEDELGENTFSSLDFEAEDIEDVDPAVLAVVDPLALDAEVAGIIAEDPLDMSNEDSEDDDADDLDDGFSEFNDYEE